jgi:tetratricopeptide (TPR) repeat protein
MAPSQSPMKSFPFYIAKICAGLIAGIFIYTSNFSFAAGTNHVDASSADADKFGRWQQLTTDTVKALRANQMPEAIRLCEDALALSADFGPTNTCFSRTQALRAEVYMWENKPEQAAGMFKQAVASCEKAAGTNSPELIYPLSSEANFYYFVDRHPDRVVEIFERILSIVQNSAEAPARDRIVWSRNLGKMYQETGSYAKAEPLFRRAIQLCEKDDTEWLPYELLNAADFYRDWGRLDPAEALAQRALSIREKALADGGGVDAQGELTTCLANLGATYLAQGKPSKAEASFRRALEILEKITSTDQPDLLPDLSGLAEAFAAEKKWDEGEQLYARALSIAEKSLEPNDPHMLTLLEKYAALLKARNKNDEAKKLLDRVSKIRTQAPGKD